MFGTGNIHGGMVSELERQRRGRADIANAFAQFRQQNPYATAADMQAFIDQQAGTENYLRGGMPGPEILQRIEAEGAERKRRDTTQAQLGEMQKRAQTMGQMEAIANQFMLQSGDAAEAERAFIEAMGGSQNLTGIPVQQFINPQAMERARAGKSMELLPAAMDLMEATGGTIQAADLARQLGVNPAIAETLRNRAAQRYEQQQNQMLVEKHSAFVDFIAGGMRNGLDVGDLVTQLAQETGVDPSRLQPIADQARRLIERESTERRGRTMREIEATIGEQGRALMVLNDPDRAREVLRSRLARYPDIEADDEMLDSIIAGWAAEHDAVRIDRHEQQLQQLPAMAEQHLAEITERSRAEIGNYIPNDTHLKRALLSLAGQYDITNPATINEFIQVFGNGGNAEQIRQAIIDSGKLPSHADVRQGFRQTFEAANPPPQTYSQWDKDTRRTVTEHIDGADGIRRRLDNFRNASAEDTSDPEVLAGEIEETVSLYNDIINNLQRARANSDRWLLASEPFNDQSFNQIVNEVKRNRDAHIESLRRAHEEARELLGLDAEAQPEPGSETETSQQPARPDQPRLPTESPGGRSRRGPEEPVPFRETPAGQQLWDFLSTEQQPRRGAGRGSHLRQ